MGWMLVCVGGCGGVWGRVGVVTCVAASTRARSRASLMTGT